MDAFGLTMRNTPSTVWSNQQGTTAVEFAIVAPVSIVLIIGLLYVCMALFAVGSLHYAVEEGARCASVKTVVCADANATLTYTKNHYFGPISSPTFKFAALACGNSVSGSANYAMDLGLTKFTVPITATACFP
jgi:Flp pilus assembly pilin Flp